MMFFWMNLIPTMLMYRPNKSAKENRMEFNISLIILFVLYVLVRFFEHTRKKENNIEWGRLVAWTMDYFMKSRRIPWDRMILMIFIILMIWYSDKILVFLMVLSFWYFFVQKNLALTCLLRTNSNIKNSHLLNWILFSRIRLRMAK